MKEGHMNAIEMFRTMAAQEKFKGWPLVGEHRLGTSIPFFGQVLQYQLRTGNGVEDYFSIIRNFGWCVVFGVTAEQQVVSLVQWKPGINRASWELPPGGIGRIPPGASAADIESVTKLVYLKETGYGGGQWSYLGSAIVETGKYRGAGPDDHGLPAHMMLATGLVRERDARQPNRNEIMETLEFPVQQTRQVIESGLMEEISAVPCALLAALKLGLLNWI
jgi:hypothetical protein